MCAFAPNITNTVHPNTTSAGIPSGIFQRDPGRAWGSHDPSRGRASHQKAYNACRNRGERNVLDRKMLRNRARGRPKHQPARSIPRQAEIVDSLTTHYRRSRCHESKGR
jgi:hypothetical protein